MKTTNAVYVPVASETLTGIITHYFLWAYKTRPGERIPLNEATRQIFQIQKVSLANRREIECRVAAVRSRMAKHNLWLHYNEDGFKVIDDPQEAIILGLTGTLKMMDRSKRRVIDAVKLIEKMGGGEKCDNTDLGQAAKELYDSTVKKIARVMLPDPSDIQKYLLPK